MPCHDSDHTCCLTLIDHVNALLAFRIRSRALIHDMKNPLAGVFAAAQILADDFDEGDPRKSLLGEMMLQMTRMDGILHEFLQSTGNPEPDSSRTSLNLITAVLAKELEYHCGMTVEHRLGARNDTCNLDPPLTLVAIYDLIQVHQHINNFSELFVETSDDPAGGRIVFKAGAGDGSGCSVQRPADPDREALLRIAVDLLEREKAVVNMNGAGRSTRFLEITFPLAERK